MRARPTEAATTLVWIEDEEAIIVRWTDRATVEWVRHDVLVPGPDDAGAIDRDRGDGLGRFAHQVAVRVPPTDDVLVIGPGSVRARLERVLRADDRRAGRRRLVHAAASDRLTEQELVARVRALEGEGEDGPTSDG